VVLLLSSSSCRPHPVIMLSAWSSLSVHSQCHSSLLSSLSLLLCTIMLLTAPILPASRGSQQQVWVLWVLVLGTTAVSRSGVVRGGYWAGVGGVYLTGTSLDEPSSGLPTVILACCCCSSTSESLTSIRRGGGDAYFGRPSWVSTK
jgi:hypothetical protein